MQTIFFYRSRKKNDSLEKQTKVESKDDRQNKKQKARVEDENMFFSVAYFKYITNKKHSILFSK